MTDVDKSFGLSLVVWGKMRTFAVELRKVKKMSVYSLGIPFKITCGGDAASQFYNLLQERNAGDKRAVFYGESAVNAARNFFSRNSVLYNNY